MPAPSEEFQQLDLDALIALVRDETAPDRLDAVWWAALSRTGCVKQWQHDESLEAGQGIPSEFVERLTEILAHAADAAPWARGFLVETHPDVALALGPARKTAAKKPAAKKKSSRG
jgi:hypothetical protein